MQIIGSIRNIPNPFYFAYQKMARIGQNIHNLFSEAMAEIWKYHGKPLHERSWKHFDQLDLIYFTGSLCIAALVTIPALYMLGLGVGLPIAVGIDSVIIIGSVAHSFSRAGRKIDHLIWNHIDEMRRSVSAMKADHIDLAVILREMDSLLRYSHRSERLIHQLQEEVRKFRDFSTKNPAEDVFEQTKVNFINYLDDLQKKIDPELVHNPI